MRAKPLYAKAHAQGVADEYQRLGWTVALEFRAPGIDEPYEYILKWDKDDDPPPLDWSKFGIAPEDFRSKAPDQT
jgi:hypothetical protein